MNLTQQSFELATGGRGTTDVTARIQALIEAAHVRRGLATIFVHHTSASLVLCENADPRVRRDLEAWLARAVPDGDPLYRHDDEGPDDMPAHVRTALTQSSLTVPIVSGRLDLGRWQGLFLYEHRHHGDRRRISVSVLGE